MDCVTDAGEAVILYFADLRWRGLQTAACSVLESRPGSKPRTRVSLAGFHLSSMTNEIHLEHQRLQVSGVWRANCPPVQRTVYEDRSGSILWNCVQPGSRVTLHLGGRELTGLGYAECLSVTLPPWRLPLRQLRWGRFVSQEHSLTWIDWQGSHCTSFAVVDGSDIELLSVSGSEVATSNAVLRISEGVSLRSGLLKSTILPEANTLKRLFPPTLFNIREQKWKSPGTLFYSGGNSKGWVIHEVVDWVR